MQNCGCSHAYACTSHPCGFPFQAVQQIFDWKGRKQQGLFQKSTMEIFDRKSGNWGGDGWTKNEMTAPRHWYFLLSGSHFIRCAIIKYKITFYSSCSAVMQTVFVLCVSWWQWRKENWKTQRTANLICIYIDVHTCLKPISYLEPLM